MENLELVRQARLKSMFLELLALKKLLKPYHGRPLGTSVVESEMYLGLKNYLRGLRTAICNLQTRDPLRVKEVLKKDRSMLQNRIEYYTNEDGSRISFSKFIDDNGQEVKFVISKFQSYWHVNDGTCGYDMSDPKGARKYSSLLHWKDNFLAHIKSNGKIPLYQKSQYFRIGDLYYKWEDYFPFDGKAYDRKKYGLYNKEIKDLSKSLKVTMNTDNARGYMVPLGYQANMFMDAPAGDEFVMSKSDEQPSFIKICLCNVNTFSDGLVSDNFFYSMFKNKNKRFKCRGELNVALYLTKEECTGIEFSPSEQHKIFFEEAVDKYQKECREKGYDKEGSAYTKTLLLSRFNQNLKFEVIYLNGVDLGKSIKSQILQELFDPEKQYTAAELKARLKALSEILMEEAKHGTKK